MENNRYASLPSNKHKALVLALLSAGYILTACGGGGGSDTGTNGSAAALSSTGAAAAGAGSTAATTPAASPPSSTLASLVARGPVTALGGLTVNNVRYDDKHARVQVNGRDGRLDDLRLGMMVEIEAEKNSATSALTARSIHSHSLVEGVVQSIDRVQKKITIMGTPVTIAPSTVFEGISGLDDISFKIGDFVEVHGLSAGTAGATATRIEKKTAGVAGSENIHLTGTVTQLNTFSKTFVIGDTAVTYGSAVLDSFNGGLANGIMVRVEGVSNSPNVLTAREVESADLSPAAREGFGADLDGIITDYNSEAATFKVNGMAVDASAARMDGVLANQARVKVYGVITNGAVKATKVERTDQAEGSVGANEAKVSGAIKLGNNAFQIGSITVTWNTNTRFDGVTAQTLRDNQVLGVEAVRSGDVYVATRIKAE
jgi:hypothetical protein